MNLSKEIKAFLFDIDGTLINRDLVMSDNMKNALVILKDKGYHLSINTGRLSYSVKEVLKKNNCPNVFEYIFGCNGLEKYNVTNDEVTNYAGIDPDTLRELNKFFHEEYLSLCVYENANTLSFNHFPKDEELYMLWCKQRFSNPSIFDYENNERSFPKAIVIFDLKNKEDFFEKIKELKNDKIDFFLSGKDVMEIVPKEYNKGNSVYEYAKILNITNKEILCAGDAESDIPALRNGTGLFVGHDYDYEKENIDYHCKSVLDDGVYNFLKNEGFLD